MKTMSSERIKFYKEKFPAGTRIQLDRMGDDPNPIPKGTKQTKQLETLQAEIGNSLIGNSVYSSEDLAAAIKIAKKSVEDIKAKLEDMTSKLEEAKSGADNVPILYQRFLGWANEFDTASNEQKKMIICGLCDRIEVSRDYEVRIVVDMDYGQFCG